MPDTPETPLENIAPLLRLGLDDEPEPSMADPNATIMVTAPSPRTGGSGQSGGGSRGWNPPSVEELQQMLPQYEISAFIARGGMGAVYKGMQKTLKRPVAIKVLPPDLEDGDLQFAARFKHEAQAMAQLSHPHIVAVFDAGETPDGLLYFVMEFIEGTDVAQLIASEGQLDPLRAIQITTAVCEALAFAHEEGIIHRDIKPSNIMLDKKGRVKVADFGLAKTVNLEHSLQTQSNMALGTPDFIAPEALMPGMKLDGRADLYAVGVMLYQMLTGTIPRGRFELPSGVVAKVDKGFDAVVDKAMQTDREKRYSTAFEMKTAVEKVGEGSVGIRSAASQPARSVSSGGKAAENVEAGKSARSPLSTVKSRTPLLIAAAVVVIGTGAFFAFKNPVTPPTNDNPVSSSQSLLLSQSSSTTEPWVDALAAPEGNVLAFAEIIAQGLRLSGRGQLKVKTDKGPRRDGAVRMKAAYDPNATGLHLRVRCILPQDSGHYTLALTDAGHAELRRVDTVAKSGATLAQYPLPTALKPGQDYALELRAVGTKLTATFNSTVLGEMEDPTLPEGQFGIGNSAETPVLVKSVEYLNLDGGTLSSSPSPPVSESSAPTWQAMTFPTEEATEASKRTRGSGLEHGRLGVWRNGMKGFPQQQAVKNGAVRVTMMWDAATQNPRLITRNKGNAGHYIVQLALQAVNITKHPESGSDTNLKSFPLPQPLKPGEEFTAQFASIGSQHYVWLNDQLLGSVTDDTVMQSGVPAVQAEDARFKRVEMLALDGLSEAEALKAAGIEAVSSSPGLPASSDAAPRVASGELSRSARLPASKSPSPTWRKAITRFEDVPAVERAKGTLRWQDGWLEPTSTTQSPPIFILPGPKLRNSGIRVRGRWSPDIDNPTLGNVFLRRTPGADTTNQVYRATAIGAPTSSVGLTLMNDKTKAQEELARLTLPRPLVPGDEYELELIAIGDQLHVRLNDVRLPVVTDTRLKEGSMGLHCIHPMRDVEVIHLDGLSEAEARKAAGITGPQESGPLSPLSGTSVANAPGTAQGTVRTTLAPVWRKVLTKPEDLPTEVRGPSIIEWKDGWMDANASGDSPSVRILGTDGRNQGIRLHGKVTAPTGSSIGSVIWLRRVSDPNGKSTDYRLFLGAGESPIVAIQHDDRALAQESEPFTFIRPEPALKPGDEYDMELYAIGGKLIARFNGRPLAEVTDIRLTEGYMGIQSKHLIRDVEIINLDGLSEAEARKVAGAETTAIQPSTPDPITDAQGKAVYPPGIWTRYETAEEENANTARKDGAWRLLAKPNHGRSIDNGVPMANGGLRARFRGQRIKADNFPQMLLRSSKTGDSVNLYVDPTGKKLLLRLNNLRSNNGLHQSKIAEIWLREPLVADKAYLMEFYAVGTTLIGRVNGETVSVQTTEPPIAGGFSIYNSDGDFLRDMQVINLDGLSEAEALKAANIEATSSERPLFDGKTVGGWRGYGQETLPAGVRVVDGAITGPMKATIITQEEFDDFDLRFDWKVGSEGNGGIFFHVPKGGTSAIPHMAPQFNLMDDGQDNPWKTGCLFGVMPPLADAARPSGEWNTGRLLVRGTQAEHYVNDQLVCRYDLGSEEIRRLLNQSKEPLAQRTDFAAAKRGAIGLEFWDGAVFYRNLRVQAVDAAGFGDKAAAPNAGALGPSALPKPVSPSPSLPGSKSSSSASPIPDGPTGFVKELVGHTGSIKALRALPDSRRLVSVADRKGDKEINEVILWDVETGKPLWTKQLLDVFGSISVVEVLPAAGKLVTLLRGPKSMLTYQDLETGAVLQRVPINRDGILGSLKASPDGKRFMLVLYSAQTGGDQPVVLQLWDADSQEPLGEWNAGTGWVVNTVAWLDENRVLAGYTDQQGQAQALVDVKVSGTVRKIAAQRAGVAFYFAPAPGKPDQILAHKGTDKLALFDLGKETIVAQFSTPVVQRQLAFLDDHRVLGMSTIFGDALRLWDIRTGKLLWEQPDARLYDQMMVSPDGRYAVTNISAEYSPGKTMGGDKLLVWRLPR